MSIVFFLNSEAEENLLDLGIPFDEIGTGIVAEVTLEDDDDVLIESLSPDELAEFFGIDSENVVGFSIHTPE